ncbi:MAG: DUF5106 domain-containing protein [Bacteroides sp.]|nr:DUF5106 domain-containing protein [Bacteroides sp.]
MNSIINKNKHKLLNAVSGALLCMSMCAVTPVFSQEYIEIEPLFEYISAPEELATLDEKSNYLVEHFWDKMDFKTKTTVDQTALNHAFKVYTTTIRFAEKNKATASVNKLLENLSKNPTLLLQFTKAAEENIYGPRADVWIDEVYIKFLQTLIKNKKIPQARKDKYEKQLSMLESSIVGNKAPQFKFENSNGTEASYFPMTTPTILIFGDPANTDWRIARLRMETNTALNQAVEKGKINILFILPDFQEGWKDEVANYPQRWTVGCADKLGENLDIRAKSSIYFASVWFVDSEGKIALKNTPLEEVIVRALDSVN